LEAVLFCNIATLISDCGNFHPTRVGIPRLKPTATLLEAVLKRNESVPTAVLAEPVMFAANDVLPIAVFELPVVFANKERAPSDVLLVPVVLSSKFLSPNAVLSEPVVLTFNAW
jgi:hypothetical protein